MLCESWKTGNRLAAYGSNRQRPNLFGLTHGSRLELAVVCHTKYLFLCYIGSCSCTDPRASTHILTTSSDSHSASCAYCRRKRYSSCIHAFITTRLDYCCSLYAGLPVWQSRSLDRELLSAARLSVLIPNYDPVSSYMLDVLLLPPQPTFGLDVLAGPRSDLSLKPLAHYMYAECTLNSRSLQ